MNLLLTLFLLWTCHGGIHSKNPYCTIQTGSVRVSEGDNVIIPCRFSYPGYRRDRSISLRVYWRAATSRICGQNTFIYNHTENYVHGNYTGRISLEGNPKEQNVVSLRIQRIRRTDGPMFCCRLEPEDKGLKDWQNIPGTYIQLSGEFSVQQVDAIPTIEGETIVIPCIVHSATEEIREVRWHWGDSLTCNNNPNIVRWTEVNGSQKQRDFSLVDFPRDVSLRIEGVAPSHRKHYCCEVKVGNKTALSDHATELAVAASAPSVGFSVTQSPELTVQSGGSASINCTFSSPPNRDPLWVGVYWRVGNLTGPFAYHPSQEMVHPMYKGRTELRRETELYIRNVQEADNNTSYYCFVILRFCEDLNNFSTETNYGTGTRQLVTGSAPPSGEGWVIPLVLSLIALLLLLVGTLTYLRIKGKICNSHSKGQEVNISLTTDARSPTNHFHGTVAPEQNRNPQSQTDREESSGVLYCHINHKNHRNKEEKENSIAKSEEGSSVLYAVVGRADHSAVYATVQKNNISALSSTLHS